MWGWSKEGGRACEGEGACKEACEDEGKEPAKGASKEASEGGGGWTNNGLQGFYPTTESREAFPPIF